MRGGEAFARGELGHKRIRHGHALKRLSHHAFTRARGRRFQFEVVGKAAAKGGVDLLYAVGDPNRGHAVGFENLIDPGLAVDTAGARCGDLLGAREQLRCLRRDRREHVFDLVKQQCRLLTAFEKNLGDLQRAVAVAPT